MDLWRSALSVFLVMMPMCGFSLERTHVPNFNGYYAGASLGGVISQYNLNTTTTILYPSFAFFSSSTNTANTNSVNVLGALFLGYLYTVPFLSKPVLIGPEIYGDLGQPKFSTSQTASATLPTESLATTTKAHLNFGELGVDIRLGGLVTSSTLLFGRVGAAFNTITAETVSTISRPALPLSTAVNNSRSKFCVGIRLGGGIEQKITPKINFRADYIFTHYPSINLSALMQSNVGAPIIQLGPIANSTTIQANTNTILASLVYQLNL